MAVKEEEKMAQVARVFLPVVVFQLFNYISLLVGFFFFFFYKERAQRDESLLPLRRVPLFPFSFVHLRAKCLEKGVWLLVSFSFIYLFLLPISWIFFLPIYKYKRVKKTAPYKACGSQIAMS